MLVLKRKLGQEVVISDRDGNELAVVAFVSYVNGGVRLGFSAPQDCVIHRREVWDAIEKKKGTES